MAVEVPDEIGILMTTETVPGFPIRKRIGVVTAECVFGMHLFKDIFAAVTDIVGGRSQASQQVFRDARDTVLRELQWEAINVGANAVVAISISYNTLSLNAIAMGNVLFVTAVGTAVEADVGEEWEERYKAHPKPWDGAEKDEEEFGQLSAEQLLMVVEYPKFHTVKRKMALEALLKRFPGSPEAQKAQKIRI